MRGAAAVKRWYAVHTQPAAEAKAAFNLGAQGFDCFLPRYARQRRHARKVETVLAPLFPRYLFIRLDFDADRWRSVNGTFGVQGLVSFGERPQPAPEGVVEAMQEHSGSSGIVEIGGPSFDRGQALRIENGPLADMIGLFEEMPDQQRVILLLNLLGRPVRVIVPLETVASC